MNAAGIQALKDSLGNAQDNLKRAQMQKKHLPNFVSGNGETIDEIIGQYQKQVDDLKEALEEVEL